VTGLEIERAGKHEFVGRNDRGATVRIGRDGAPGSFSPGELLQVAAAGCAAVTVEELVVRRAGEDARITATASYERAPGVREYQQVHVNLHADLSFLEEGARERVLKAMRMAVERECTVSRTVERGAEVLLTIDATAADATAADATAAAKRPAEEESAADPSPAAGSGSDQRPPDEARAAAPSPAAGSGSGSAAATGAA
jgi:uncharacterized OsmC-like protein